MSEPAPVINCYECNRVYRMDRDCPNCARRQRRAKAERSRQRKHSFTDLLYLQPHLIAWLERRGYLADIEAVWFANLRPRLSKYDLAPMRWAELVVKLDSSCQICREPSHPLKLHIDHDHEYGNVRGLLCQKCNTGIGLLRIDGREGAKRAAAVRAYMTQPGMIVRRTKTPGR